MKIRNCKLSGCLDLDKNNPENQKGVNRFSDAAVS